MSNLNISSLSGIISRIGFFSPPPDKTEPSKVELVALPQINSEATWMTDALLAPFIKLLPLSYAKDWNNKTLASILTDPEDLIFVIEEMTPQLLEFISPLLPDRIHSFLINQPEVGKEVLDCLLTRVITNLSLTLFSDEDRQKIVNEEEVPFKNKIPAKVLASKLFDKLIHMIGEDFNAIDEKVFKLGKKLSPELFRPTLEKIFDLALPLGDLFRGSYFEDYFEIKKTLVGKGSKGCLDLYRSILNWLKREKTVALPKEKSVDLTPLHSGIGRFVKYINRELREKWQEKDSILFEQLTGAKDSRIFMENISPQIYQQLTKFFPKDLAVIFQEDDTQESLEESTKTLLLHAIATLAKEVFEKEIKEGQTVAPEQIIERVLSHFAAKLQKQFEKAHQKQSLGEVVTASDFASLSSEIIKIFLPDAGPSGEYQWLHALIERRHQELAEPLHHILLSLYLSQPAHGKVEEYKTRLKAVFRGEIGSDAAVEELYNMSSNLASLIQSQFASPLKESQKVFEELEQNSLENSFGSRLSKGVQAIFQENDSHVSWVKEQMQQALEFIIFRSFVHFFEKVPQELRGDPGQLLTLAFQQILKIGMNHLPQISSDLEAQRGRILLEVRSKLSNPESDCFIADKEKRKDAVEREVDRRLEIIGTKLIQPFLDEFMALFFENKDEALEDQISFFGEFNNPLCQKIRDGLSKQFSKMLVVTTSWMQDRTKNETRLGELYQSKNPMKLCNVLGHMTREGLSNYLKDDNVAFTEILMDFLKTYFCPPGIDPETAGMDLTFFQKMLEGFFHTAGTTNAPVIQKLMNFIGNFTETSLLRLMADFSKRFKTMEEVNADPPPFSQLIEDSKRLWTANAPDRTKDRKGDFAANKAVLKALIINPEISNEQLFAFIKFARIKANGKFLRSLANVFQKYRLGSPAQFIDTHEIKSQSLMEGIVLRLLDLGKEHFEVIGGTEKSSRTNREQLIGEFERAQKLHPAVREGEAKDEFFKTWSHRIFEIIGVSEKSSLPIPKFLKKWVFGLIEDKLVPKMLVNVMEAARKPSNLNKMMVAALQDSADVVKNNENSIWARLLPDEDPNQRVKNYAPRYNDAYQSKLEERIGGVLDALIQPNGRSIPRWLLNMKFQGSRVFHDKTAEAIGQPLRAIFRDEHDRPVSTLKLLDIAMETIADSIVEVEWSERESKIVYPKTGFDGRKTVGANGTAEYVDRPNLAKFFPKNEQEKIAAEALERKERRTAAKEVPYYLRRVISEEAKRFVQAKFLESWDIFEAKFKERFPKLSQVLSPILTFLFKIPIVFTVVFFLDIIIWCIVNAVLKLVLNKQIEKYAQDANVDVHDNLLYKFIDVGMEKIAEGIGQVYVEDEATDGADDESQEEIEPPIET